jgi:hypothetical protein
VKERVIAEEAHRETDFGAGKNSSSAFYTAHKRAKFGLASEKNYAFNSNVSRKRERYLAFTTYKTDLYSRQQLRRRRRRLLPRPRHRSSYLNLNCKWSHENVVAEAAVTRSFRPLRPRRTQVMHVKWKNLPFSQTNTTLLRLLHYN